MPGGLGIYVLEHGRVVEHGALEEPLLAAPYLDGSPAVKAP